jgi:hypothetical protein
VQVDLHGQLDFPNPLNLLRVAGINRTFGPFRMETIMTDHDTARRRLLGHAAALPVWFALPLFAVPAPVHAGNGNKEDFHYQDHPNGTKRCANCVQFIPPAAGQQLGGCQIVAGTISADGWCMAFTPKTDQ